MSIRNIRIEPDQIIECLDGTQLEVVSREKLIEAAADLAVTMHLAGGCGQIVTRRAPTGVMDEMVTIGAMVQWKDHTNAKRQPEENALDYEATASTDFDPEAAVATMEVTAPVPEVAPTDDNPDGMDLGSLVEEDETSIPVGARG